MSSQKVWLITGANSGIGLALAKYVLAQGDKASLQSVVATVRNISKFPESLRNGGAQPIIVDLNASDDVVKKASQEALRVYGRVDVLVNNAGYGIHGPVEELDLNDVRAQFQANVFGQLAFTQALLPAFRAQRAGHIFNFSSVVGFDGAGSWGAYCASKAAFELFSESLSRELELFGIRVIIVEPGYFPSEFFKTTAAVAYKESRIYTDPSQGFGTIEAVPQSKLESNSIGDLEKLSARIYEVVYGTGLAKGLVEGKGGKREWMRLPMGPDCGEWMLQKVNSVKENIEALKPIWSSTNTGA
ncbi:uncharacterized protein FIBRA_02472 [Fibroporia radiculosa]|uniref:Ketoreductase domain-containing protein n=1 Tax=Fibroporia radiculosa TaxID=599839 RepID=J4GMW5_9APHY|nr:uncharacterized protein FIBRA_02472 [Fibroporia radiculosa]CCM00440.1 predicted protein [Fibroporia radiculosa]